MINASDPLIGLIVTGLTSYLASGKAVRKHFEDVHAHIRKLQQDIALLKKLAGVTEEEPTVPDTPKALSRNGRRD